MTGWCNSSLKPSWQALFDEGYTRLTRISRNLVRKWCGDSWPAVPTRLWWSQVGWFLFDHEFGLLTHNTLCREQWSHEQSSRRSQRAHLNRLFYWLNYLFCSSGCCYSKPLLVPGGRAFVWPAVQNVQRYHNNVFLYSNLFGHCCSKLIEIAW